MAVLKFKKLRNVRDISYGNIKQGRIIRGSSLFRLCKKDAKDLKEKYNVKTIIDLRTNQEIRDKPDRIIEGAKYYHIPLITMEEMGSNSEKQAKKDIVKSHKLPDIFDYYSHLLTDDKIPSWTKIFEIINNNDEGAIYIHCTVGKDRCGTVIAILLLALGLDKQSIYQDYLLTNEDAIIPFSYKLFALSFKDKKFRQDFLEFFKAKKEYLDIIFDFIDKNYPSSEAFLEKMCGLDCQKLNKLKEKYIN